MLSFIYASVLFFSFVKVVLDFRMVQDFLVQSKYFKIYIEYSYEYKQEYYKNFVE